MALYDDWMQQQSLYPNQVGGIIPPWMPQPAVGGITGPWMQAPAQVGPITTGPWNPVPVPGSAPPLGSAPVQHLSYGRGYDPPGKDLSTSPLGRRVANMLPQGVWQNYLARRGFADPTTRKGQYMQSQYGRAQQQFQSAQIKNPALTFDRFLKTGGMGKLMREFLNLSPSQRGAQQQSRSQVVPWG